MLPQVGFVQDPSVPPSKTSLYYSKIRDHHGRAVSPVHPSRRAPALKIRRRPTPIQSTVANARFVDNQVLDAEWQGWPADRSASMRRGAGGTIGSLGGTLVGVDTTASVDARGWRGDAKTLARGGSAGWTVKKQHGIGDEYVHIGPEA